jgi:branched-chain amino acid transport system substrate-binding protein
MRTRISRRFATLAACALALSACGNRLPHQRVLASGQSGTGDQTQGIQEPGPTPGAIQSPGAIGPGGGGVGGGGPPLPGSCTGIKTGAPGVGSTEIKVGAIVARSGPLPGQFSQMTDAVEAFFKKVNSEGGVCGRFLRYIVQDDGLNADKHFAAAKKLVEEDRVFAIVGMLTAVDKASARYLCERGVPDVGGFALSYNRAQGEDCPKGKPPVYWSPIGALGRNEISGIQYAKVVADNKLKHGAVMYHSTLDISADQGLAQQWALNNTYCKSFEQPSNPEACEVPASRQQKTFVPDSQLYDVNPVSPDSAYDAYVQSMMDGRVDSVFTSMELNSNIKLLRAINRYRSLWRQRVGRDPVIYFQLSAYDPKLLRESGSLAKGVFLWIPHVPFTEPTQPMMADYLASLHRYVPGAQPSSFGAQGWAGAMLFVDALRKVGQNLTRETLRQALDTFIDYTANGLTGPLTPRDRVIFHCGVVVQVQERNGALDFWRWTPDAGFVCGVLRPWR